MVKIAEPVVGQQNTSRGRGRPTNYSAELAAEFCNYLAQGMSMRKACKQKNMPAMTTVFRWLSESNTELWANDFREQYARAKQESADAMAEDILDISDEKVKYLGDGKPNTAEIARNRLRVDTRKFLMAKMKPKIYGDKMDLTTDGEKIEIGRGMSIEEIQAILDRAEAEKKTEAANAEKTSPSE